MLPVALACPLWWLARWAARVLTGFAVAAAFTLGAWAAPASAGPAWAAPASAEPASAGPAWAVPADQRGVAGTVRSAADTTPPSARAGRDAAAPDELTGATTPIVLDAGARADQTGAPTTPPVAPGRPGLRVLGTASTEIVSVRAAVVLDAQAARGPPHA
ncbi:hypothetical protein SAMN05443287_101623 [Micromonospora phaseoli]|uniref:Uncharacterized protein n=1 Tax=Micromonospora phaseoli TaxID=1144548 RepID=A0A1H6S9W9_9ACTN|nr:hypothetical protein [Micromonospora phaseoli]PZW03872.1 hypothetical protein CLV64_101623 [Micromonospora phaseoli]GIJ77714.1 hypothetical protein Xph01_21460 [Micromonospora phaseoli]SEI64908.1 hypothetical protein SAMN05443287_101623 [Micromonospora phaseoli]